MTPLPPDRPRQRSKAGLTLRSSGKVIATKGLVQKLQHLKKEGRLKHKLTGRVYRLQSVKGGTFVLESAATPYRLWLGVRELEQFFDTVRER